MPDMPGTYDDNAGTDSEAGGAATSATPATGASTQPGAAPVETTSTAPATAPQLQTEPANQTMSPAERSIKAENWGTKVYHGVLNALGGGGDVTYTRDPQSGKMTATPVATGPGTQWKKIIAGALTGFSAAAAAGGTGPGSGLRAAGAGVGAGLKMGMGQNQQAREHADEDYEAAQKAATNQAQLALLSHQIAKSTFDLGRAQVNASFEDSDRETNFSQVITAGGNGSQDMGVFPDFQSVIKAFKEAPELHDHQAGGRIIAIPHINGKGQVDGIHAALVTPDWLNSKINRELPITVNSYKDGKLEQQTFTVPAGSLTGQQYASMVQAQSKDSLDEWKTQVTEKRADTAETREEGRATAENIASRASARQSYAAADKDEAEAKALNEATTAGAMQSNAQQLYEGSMDPSNLSKRSKTYDATLAAANSISMARESKPFDIAKAIGDYKFATNPQTYNTLNFLNSLTGRDNQSGNLGTVVGLSDKLGRSNFPPLNAVEQWAKLSAGNSQIAAYRGALVETSDQIAKILQGGGSGNGTSDTKLKDAQELLSKNFNVQQIKDTAATLRDLLANRKKEIIGDNRYLMRWHGVQQPGGGTPAALPDAAMQALRSANGGVVTFGNQQQWKLDLQGNPVQVK